VDALGSVMTFEGAVDPPHPTLSETVGMAAQAFEGTITDVYLPKRR
jgi:hypothetical protein